MKKALSIIFFFQYVFASVTYANEENKKVFTSELGYKITYPNCMVVEPSHYDETDLKPEALVDVNLSRGVACSKNVNKTYLSIRPDLSYVKKTVDENFRAIEGDIKDNIRLGKNLYPSVKRFDHPAGKAILVVRNFVPPGKLRWEVRIACEQKLFKFTINTEHNIPSNPDLFEKVKKDPLFLPEPEKSIIESFQCVNAVPKKTKDEKD